ncbi:tripartite tricarboxylate transporter substrate binding protein [Hydrogenophaga crocea]|jgi:tripartite-type tricarboxylate transporter receptor subunit TctC|uniref:Tripartite tricarboxylate transporter substrate binding protein n=1 Tax=Hydrogenophaga crocea TaxID=2716225 RepID=A0A6G8IJ77_9BURK|nr:tripartite tricarboxylate transporter substrate binding protein [Hydrogenophaga crocea]QIM53201.1 tripartite tricarboxylate transporter substrate binding protein [Hydrogenophaga crocea]
MRIHLKTLLLATVTLALTGTGHAQDGNYPNRPIKLIVGLSPGASSDTVAREVARGLTEKLKVPVVVENRAGANTIIASNLVAKAPADGYTLLVSSSMNATNPWVYEKLPYDYNKDLKNIVLLGMAPNLMVSSTKSGITSFNQFIDHAKKNPGKLAYGSAGIGSVHHLLMEIIALRNGITLNHIPYRGGAPAIQDVLGGNLDTYFGTISSTKSAVDRGSMNALFVTSHQRSKYMPKADTLAEHGIKGLESGYWLGLAAPAGVPDAIVKRLNDAVNEVLKDPAVLTHLDGQAIEPRGGTVADMDAFFQRELVFWKEAAQAAKITPMEAK